MTLKQTIKNLSLSLIISFAAASLVHAEESSERQVPPEGLREAFRACESELGIERPEPGQRPQAPNDEQRAAMDACLKEKGFEPPTKMGPPPSGGKRSQGSR